MAPADDVASQTPADAQHPILRAQLAIEPQPESNCLVLRKGGDATEIKHHRKQPSPNTGGQEDPEKECCDECHAELTFSETEPSRREYVTTSVEADCICPVFDDHDCIPDIRDIRAHSIIVVVTVPSRSALQALIQDLSATAASLSVDWLVMGEDDEMTTEIDVSSITPKQREALNVALEAGYYESPRESDLSTLAERLDISESAISQRLNAAETKLVKSFLDE